MDIPKWIQWRCGLASRNLRGCHVIPPAAHLIRNHQKGSGTCCEMVPCPVAWRCHRLSCRGSRVVGSQGKQPPYVARVTHLSVTRFHIIHPRDLPLHTTGYIWDIRPAPTASLPLLPPPGTIMEPGEPQDTTVIISASHLQRMEQRHSYLRAWVDHLVERVRTLVNETSMLRELTHQQAKRIERLEEGIPVGSAPTY